MKNTLSFQEFLEIQAKLEITYGQIISAERIPKSTRLLKLKVKFGPEDEKTVVTNLGSHFEPEQFEGLILPFVTNLTPSVMLGVTSEAMIMVGESGGAIELKDFSIGSKLL